MKSGYIRVDADMSGEPEFAGNLAVEVSGTDRSGVEVIRFKVHISVVAPNDISRLCEDIPAREMPASVSQ
jgi:hypothetical protein